VPPVNRFIVSACFVMSDKKFYSKGSPPTFSPLPVSLPLLPPIETELLRLPSLPLPAVFITLKIGLVLGSILC